MENFFARQAVFYRNQLAQSCSELCGIAEGLIADRQINDDEIRFLNRWLDKHDAVSCDWPGDVLHAKVKEVLTDGVVTEEERTHLISMLTKLIGGRLDDLADAPKVNELAIDSIDKVTF